MRLILGTKGFVEWAYQNFVDREKKEIPLRERKPKPKVSVLSIMQNVGNIYDIPVKKIRHAQSGLRNDARSMTVYLIRQLTGLGQKEIARWLNVSEANTVAQMQYRFCQRLMREKPLKKLTRIVQNSILSTVDSAEKPRLFFDVRGVIFLKKQINE